MKKFALLAVLLLPVSFATSPREIIESAAPLVAAIGALPGIQGINDVSAHLSGYGLQINALASVPQFGAPYDRAITSLQDILVGLSASVQGLNEGDWVSIGLQVIGTTEGTSDVVVRVKPGQPETLETWIDGIKQ